MNVTKELIFNHFERKATPLQRKIVDEWLLSPVNEELYYLWLEEWENNNLQYIAQTDLEFIKFTEAMQANSHGLSTLMVEYTDPTSAKSFWLDKWTYVAAIVLLCGGVWLFRDLITYKQYRTEFGEVKSITLEDGTKVKLNTNSLLRVPRWGFGSDNRKVFLNGEANFNVKHMANHQNFVVKTDKQFEVVVLGTEFTMYSRKRNSRVILNKGKVQVLYKDHNASKEVMMKPGDLVSLNSKNQLQIRTTQKVKDYAAWEEKRFVFEETSVEEIAYLLRENYDFQVEIKSKELSERVVMGSFRAENADDLLKAISELLDINVVRQGNKVQLSDR